MLRALLLVLALGGAACVGDAPAATPGSTSASTATTSTTTTTTTTTTTSTTLPPPPVAGFIGDSLLHQIRRLLPPLLPERLVTIESAPGLLAADSIWFVQTLERAGVDAVGVVLGSNDVLDTTDPFDRHALRATLRSLDWVECIRWVALVPTSVLGNAAQSLNEELFLLAAGDPRVELVRWDLRVAEDPSLLSEDRLHLSEAGRVALAEELAAAIRSCPAD